MHWKRLAGALDHLGEAGAGKRRAALRDEHGSAVRPISPQLPKSPDLLALKRVG